MRYLKQKRLYGSVPIYIYIYTATPLARYKTPGNELIFRVEVWMELIPRTLENWNSLRRLAIPELYLVDLYLHSL